MVKNSVLYCPDARGGVGKRLIGRFFAFLFACAAVLPSIASANGTFDWTPILRVEQLYVDNLLYQPEDKDPLSTNLTTLEPRLKFQHSGDATKLYLNLQYKAGIYSESSEDNYDDASGQLGFDWLLNSRNEIQVSSLLQDVHEDRGTGYSQGGQAEIIASPDTFRKISNRLQYRFGAKEARGRFVFKAEDYSQTATSREETLSFSDYDQLRLSAELNWRIGGRTKAVLEVRKTTVDYENDVPGSFSNLDNYGHHFLGGVTWEGSGKTSGTVRLGQATKNFYSKNRDDFSGFSWEIEANWSPLSHSTFTLSTSRDAKEPDARADYIDATEYKLSWRYKWSGQGELNMYAATEDEDYVGAEEPRSETEREYGASLDYTIRYWMKVGAILQIRTKESTIETLEYDANRIGAYINWSF